MSNITTYHDLLSEEFEKRKLINSSYSLRAFARDLGISAPRLSQVLNKKQGLSLKAAQEIVAKMNLSEEEKEVFCNSVGSLHARNFKEREEFKAKVERYKSESKSFSELQLEYFKVISDWYHFAILELTYLKEFKYDLEWIAKVLEITKEEVAVAIQRMKDLDLIEEKEGKLVDVFKFLETTNDIPSLSLKKFNIQLMQKAIAAVHEQDVHNREIASNVIAVNKKDLPKFKKKIREFKRDFEKTADETSEKNSVYCLGMQFFELIKE